MEGAAVTNRSQSGADGVAEGSFCTAPSDDPWPLAQHEPGAASKKIREFPWQHVSGDAYGGAVGGISKKSLGTCCVVFSWCSRSTAKHAACSCNQDLHRRYRHFNVYRWLQGSDRTGELHKLWRRRRQTKKNARGQAAFLPPRAPPSTCLYLCH